MEESNNNFSDPSTTELRSFLGSGSVLAMAVMSTCHIFFSFLSDIIPSHPNLDRVFMLMNQLGLYDYLSSFEILNTSQDNNVFINLGLIPYILTCVAFYMIYFSAKNNSGSEMSTSGFSILYVTNIIGIVGWSLVLLLLLVAFLFLLAVVFSFSETGVELLIFALATCILLLSFVFGILFLIKNVKLTSVIDKTSAAVNGVYNDKQISAFPSVMFFINAGIAILNLLWSILLLGFQIASLSIIFQGAYMILLGINILKLKNILE